MSEPTPSEDVAARLEALYDAYDGFDVTQTTVTVGRSEFESVESRGDVAEVRVRVRGADGVLAVTEDDERVTPGGVVDGDGPLTDAAAELVAEQTGVDCRIEGLDRVSLACLQCEETGAEVWELSALFAAVADSQAPADGAAWCERLPDHSVAF